MYTVAKVLHTQLHKARSYIDIDKFLDLYISALVYDNRFPLLLRNDFTQLDILVDKPLKGYNLDRFENL